MKNVQNQIISANTHRIKKNNNHKSNSSAKLEEYDKLLSHDNKKGNNLKKFANLVTTPFTVDEVVEKKSVYRGDKK